MKTEEREYSIYEGNRPKVLLLGNGLNRAYDGMSWDSLLDYIKDRDLYPRKAAEYIMPMPLKAAMLTNNKLAKKMRELVQDSKDNDDEEKITWKYFTDTNPAMRDQIRQIVTHFDYVLTTNYSYEIEMAIMDVDELAPNQIAKLMNFHEVDNAQKKFLVNTYNLVNGIPVWHIHGEARKPDSMIIGSAYYGKLLRRCVERIDGSMVYERNEKRTEDRKQSGKEQEYKRNFKHLKPQKIGSWIDAFVLGDVYILGLGLDFSESDLWWLIDYKSSNPDMYGRTTFMDPEKVAQNVCVADGKTACGNGNAFVNERKCRDQLLKQTYHVNMENLGVIINSQDDYKEFYRRAANKFETEFNLKD